MQYLDTVCKTPSIDFPKLNTPLIYSAMMASSNSSPATIISKLPIPRLIKKTYPDDWTGFTNAEQSQFRALVGEKGLIPPQINGLSIPPDMPLLWVRVLRSSQRKPRYNSSKDPVFQLSHNWPRSWMPMMKRMDGVLEKQQATVEPAPSVNPSPQIGQQAGMVQQPQVSALVPQETAAASRQLGSPFHQQMASQHQQPGFYQVQQLTPQPSVYQPALHQPSVYQTPVRQPIVHQSKVHQLSIYQPTMNQPAIHLPATYHPASHHPALYQAATYQPALYPPSLHRPATNSLHSLQPWEHMAVSQQHSYSSINTWTKPIAAMGTPHQQWPESVYTKQSTHTPQSAYTPPTTYTPQTAYTPKPAYYPPSTTLSGYANANDVQQIQHVALHAAQEQNPFVKGQHNESSKAATDEKSSLVPIPQDKGKRRAEEAPSDHEHAHKSSKTYDWFPANTSSSQRPVVNSAPAVERKDDALPATQIAIMSTEIAQTSTETRHQAAVGMPTDQQYSWRDEYVEDVLDVAPRTNDFRPYHRFNKLEGKQRKKEVRQSWDEVDIVGKL